MDGLPVSLSGKDFALEPLSRPRFLAAAAQLLRLATARLYCTAAIGLGVGANVGRAAGNH